MRHHGIRNDDMQPVTLGKALYGAVIYGIHDRMRHLQLIPYATLVFIVKALGIVLA